MAEKCVHIDEGIPPWNVVQDIAGAIDPDSWILVGGLMVQIHAMLMGRASRSTKDVDLLINLLATRQSVGNIVRKLEGLGYSPKEPGLRGSPFHRMVLDEEVVDILVADHLPSRKRRAAAFNRWPAMEITGGAQALERSESVEIVLGDTCFSVNVPNILGAIILKSAAFQTDRRDRRRHLEDVALLCSLVEDVKTHRTNMHGSDSKRVHAVDEALRDINDPVWLTLSSEERLRGQDVLRILGA